MNQSIPLAQQGAIFSLLGRVFISELDMNTIHTLQDPNICQVMDKLQPGFSKYINETQWDDASINQLASDYCHLFILPQKTGLSLQANHWLLNDETFDIAKLESVIENLNIDLSSLNIGEVNLPKDHLSLLLYFISAVLGSPDNNIQALGHQIANLVLIPWALRFIDKLSAAETNPLYLASADLLRLQLSHLDIEGVK